MGCDSEGWGNDRWGIGGRWTVGTYRSGREGRATTGGLVKGSLL